MFRTLYIFLAIFILRGCPKIMPLVDQDPSDTPAWTVNSTSIANSRKPLHLMTNAFAVYDISSGVKLLTSTQSTDSIYTGLVPSAVSAHIRDTVEKFKKDTAEFFSEHWFTILIAVSIALPIMAPTTILLVFFVDKYLEIYPS
ncbi:hypothetical protein AAHC03_04496 [Spirometra sp. Aus1]